MVRPRMEKPQTLLLLPGLDGTEVFFRPFMRALPPWIRPQAVCYPAGGSNSYEELLGVVRQAAAEAGPCWVLASSFGGPLAVLLAESEPHRVRGLIMAATFLRTPDEQLARWRFLTVTPVVALLRTARRIPVWMGKHGGPMRAAKAETWARVASRTLAARARAALAADVRSVYRRCPQPVLCVAFAEDRVVPRARAAEIVDGRPDARLVVLPGGHLAMHTSPLPFRDAVTAFIAERRGLDTAASSV